MSCITTILIIFYVVGLVFKQTVDNHIGDNSEEPTSLGMTDSLEEPAKVEMPHHGDGNENGNEEVRQSKELCRADCTQDR
jgi:hypothetical protein